MKFIIVASIFAAVSAVPSLVNTGSSAIQRYDDGYGNYAFGYNEDHATGGTFRKEQGGPGYMSGSYGLRDIDGRIRVVNYIADHLGYRTSISTNEPGVDAKQDPAAVDINYGNGYATPAIIAAPLVSKSYAAPVVAAPTYSPSFSAAPLIGARYASPAAYVVTQRRSYAPTLYASSPAGYGKAYNSFISYNNKLY